MFQGEPNNSGGNNGWRREESVWIWVNYTYKKNIIL